MDDSRRGLAAGLSAYLLWGLIPLYLKLLVGVAALDVLAHRVLWSAVLLACTLAFVRRRARLREALRQPRLMGLLLASTAMIATNWLVYTWAILNAHMLDTSLGYFMLPLLSVALGVALNGERLTRPQQIAVGLAATGVAIQTVALGNLPWVAVLLALSFGFYGFIRNRAAVDPVTGILIETALLAPIALLWLELGSVGVFGEGRATNLILMAAGIVTTVPLALFGYAARRLTLSTLGFLQYLPPSIVFVLAVALYGEPLEPARLAAFTCIWAGLVVYSLGGLQRRRIAVEP